MVSYYNKVTINANCSLVYSRNQDHIRNFLADKPRNQDHTRNWPADESIPQDNFKVNYAVSDSRSPTSLSRRCQKLQLVRHHLDDIKSEPKPTSSSNQSTTKQIRKHRAAVLKLYRKSSDSSLLKDRKWSSSHLADEHQLHHNNSLPNRRRSRTSSLCDKNCINDGTTRSNGSVLTSKIIPHGSSNQNYSCVLWDGQPTQSSCCLRLNGVISLTSKKEDICTSPTHSGGFVANPVLNENSPVQTQYFSGTKPKQIEKEHQYHNRYTFVESTIVTHTQDYRNFRTYSDSYSSNETLKQLSNSNYQQCVSASSTPKFIRIGSPIVKPSQPILGAQILRHKLHNIVSNYSPVRKKEDYFNFETQDFSLDQTEKVDLMPQLSVGSRGSDAAIPPQVLPLSLGHQPTMLCERPPELISPPNVIITEIKGATVMGKGGHVTNINATHQCMKVRLVEVRFLKYPLIMCVKPWHTVNDW